MTDTAETIEQYLHELDQVYDANVVSAHAVMAVVEVSHADDAKSFDGLAERGWRVGSVVPKDASEVFHFVPIGGGQEDGSDA